MRAKTDEVHCPGGDAMGFFVFLAAGIILECEASPDASSVVLDASRTTSSESGGTSAGSDDVAGSLAAQKRDKAFCFIAAEDKQEMQQVVTTMSIERNTAKKIKGALKRLHFSCGAPGRQGQTFP